MSLTLIRSFNHAKCSYASFARLNKSNRVCFHCSTQHKQNDKPTEDFMSSATPKFYQKEEVISRAMQNYLERMKESEDKQTQMTEEYDLGRRHLANIMGVEERHLGRKKIREAITYLLPSGLHNINARPMMEHPLDLMPVIKSVSFDNVGRPKHPFFYTAKPLYYQLMHEMAVKLDELRAKSATMDTTNFEPMSGVGYKWKSVDQFRKKLPNENVSKEDYNRFIVMMERICEQPAAYTDAEFGIIQQYRSKMAEKTAVTKPMKILKETDGREYVVTEGSRKKTQAKVKLVANGTGKVRIDKKDILYFDQVSHREAILYPLHLCGVLDKYDIEASLFHPEHNPSPSADAGAIRLAIARGLCAFISKQEAEKMRLAGLLTRDPRNKERKKPGQEKARRKFTWRAR